MIDPLPVGKNERFTSRLSPEIPFVRTGTEMEGSCFFHALFMAFREFRILSEDEKRIYVQHKRRALVENMTLTRWFQIQNGDLAFLQIIEMMRIMIYLIPSLITDPNETHLFSDHQIDKKVVEVLFHLLDPTQVDRDMLPNWDVECCKIEKNDLSKEILLHRMKSKWHDIYQDNIRKAIDQIENELDPSVPKMKESVKLTVIHKLSDLSYFIFDYVVEKAYQQFREELSQYENWINVFHYLYLIDCMDMKTNVLFLDATSGLPFEGMRYFDLRSLRNKRPYVILLYFPDYHFEAFGERLETGPKKALNRLFPSDHPFIQAFFEYLENHPQPPRPHKRMKKEVSPPTETPGADNGPDDETAAEEESERASLVMDPAPTSATPDPGHESSSVASSSETKDPQREFPV